MPPETPKVLEESVTTLLGRLGKDPEGRSMRDKRAPEGPMEYENEHTETE